MKTLTVEPLLYYVEIMRANGPDDFEWEDYWEDRNYEECLRISEKLADQGESVRIRHHDGIWYTDWEVLQ